MKKSLSAKLFYILLTVTLSAVCALRLCACDKNDDLYAYDNAFNIAVHDGDDALIFEPQNVVYRYGIIFYVGALISPSQYAYLGDALAKQGYLVVIPKFTRDLSYVYYQTTEPAFEKFPNVRFFISGHGLGGGAAVRRAQENPNSTLGLALYSPICSSRQVLDENGNLTFDENGEVVKIYDSVAHLSLHTLLLEAKGENIVTDEISSDAKNRLNMSTTEYHRLSESGYTGFYTVTSRPDNSALTDEQRQSQQARTIELTLAFMRGVIFG